MAYLRRLFWAAACLLLAANSAQAGFHVMQIEQIIGGVNGDVTAQAIQLRMRTGSQNVVSLARVSAVNASGASPVLLKDMTTDVSNFNTGDHVLLATPSFANYTNIPLVADFTMSPIPMSYLAAGQLRFTDDGGTLYWTVSWGGAGFTGSTIGEPFHTNDADGNFGPPVATALPSATLQALRFTGLATAPSTTNLADYAVTAGAATFTNNAGTNFTVVAAGDFTGNGVVNNFDLANWANNFGLAAGANHTQGDADGDHDVDGADFLKWQEETTSAGTAVALGAAVPEPAAIALTVIAAGAILRAAWRARRWACAA